MFFFTFNWNKIRVLYYINNWVYTTNHKRIAVNYFWFVILSGIVGMVLATIIRLELAYPGVGIFAGDSLQYLSMVSAHGVIMVFFMIMPLLFGAFGNFLLPTQLGVHDVAFPRLNSAAFWFLPAGLIMLAQLVCVDRRYQRMNCFNIREVQSLLKKKFFADLIDTTEFTTLLDKSMIGLKYKTNDIAFLNSHSLLHYQFGLNKKNNSNFFKYNSKLANEGFFFSDNNEQKIKPSLFNNIDFQKNIRGWSFDYFFVKLFYFFSEPVIKRIDQKSVFNFFYISQVSIANASPINWIKTNVLVIVQSASTNFLNAANWLFSRTISAFILRAQKPITKFYVKLKKKNENFDWYSTDPFDPKSFDYKLYMFLDVKTPVMNKWYRIYYSNQLSIRFYYAYHAVAKKLDQLLANIYIWSAQIFLSQIYLIWSQTGQTFFFNVIREILANPFHKNFNLYDSNGKIVFSHNNHFQDVNSQFYAKKNFSFFDKFRLEHQIENILEVGCEKKNFLLLKSRNDTLRAAELSSFFVYFNVLVESAVKFPQQFLHFIYNTYNPEQISIKFSNFWHYFLNWVLTTFFDINYMFSFSFLFKDFFFSNIYTAIVFFIKTFIGFINFILTYTAVDFIYIFKNTKILIESFVYFLKTEYFFYQYFLICELYLAATNSFFRFFQVINLSHLNYNDSLSAFKSVLNYVKDYKTNVNKKTSTLEKNEDFKTESLSFLENEISRYTRFTDPVFKYDYKSGDYFPKIYKEVYKHLFTSIINITNGLKTASWFNFINLEEIFQVITKPTIYSVSQSLAIRSLNTRMNPITSFQSIFKTSNNDFGIRWVSYLTLNQKFYNMFLTSSMQQRIYGNWRQLKFTREAWRCKMLSARHQKTLFKRYVHEDGVFWSIERNAKDLIPGWAMITPFSSRTRFTAVGKVDIGLLGVLLVLNSSIISGANFLVTYRYLSTLNNRKMRDARSFFTEGVMVTSWMMILANPMLVIGIIMLLSDRHWQTSFFDYSGGGDTILFQHMFWFFGHPEVYVILIPVFGFTNTILSYYLRKRVSARASLMYSLYTIAFLGFFVWGHHMYMVGLAHTTRMLFSTLTVMISVPAATKLMHWCVTMANSAFVVELPFLFVLTFVFFFVSGGISGMYVAHTGMDILFHDTFYVIGHFHVMLAGGAMFGSFGAFYFYFPAIFGVKYSRIYAYLHYTYYLIGQLMTVVPMFWLGYAGMPRRILDYPASLGGWHSVISAGHMLSVAGLIAFFIMIFDSLRQSKAVVRNTYGINRFNTRLNFYLYETSRLTHVQRRNLFIFKPFEIILLKLNNLNYQNYEYLETTLMSYVFFKKK